MAPHFASFLLFAHALATFATGSGATLSGFVLDGRTGAPVADARVELRRAGIDTRSDATGYFEFGSREVGVDSLLVTHPDYEAGGLLLGDTDGALQLRVGIFRRRSAAPEPDGTEVARREAEALAVRMGGHAWLPDDFRIHAARAQHALQLLPFSGFLNSLEERAGGVCVRLAADRGCAAIWVNGVSGSSADLRTRFPGEVLAFVIVPPARSPTAGREDGMIAVYLQERDP